MATGQVYDFCWQFLFSVVVGVLVCKDWGVSPNLLYLFTSFLQPVRLLVSECFSLTTNQPYKPAQAAYRTSEQALNEMTHSSPA